MYLPTQYAPKVIILFRMQIMGLTYTICYLGRIMTMGAYCVGKVHNMLPR